MNLAKFKIRFFPPCCDNNVIETAIMYGKTMMCSPNAVRKDFENGILDCVTLTNLAYE